MAQKIFSDNFLIHQTSNLKGENSNLFVAEYLKNEFEGKNIPQNSFITSNIDPVAEDLCEKMVNAFRSTSSEFDAGKILYEALKYLTPRQASNPGFWSYLHHYDLFRYIKLRWPNLENPPNNSTSENYILNHWLQDKSSQAELMDYPLSGLWWSFYITEMTESDDPYGLTQILFQNFSFRTKYLGQSKVARHKEAIIGILEFIKKNGLHLQNFEDNGLAITIYVNLLGGIKPLSYFKRDWFYEQLADKFGKDIEDYGRLYSRDEKPDKFNEKKAVVSGPEAEKSSPVFAGSPTKDQPEVSSKVLNIYLSGKFYFSEKFQQEKSIFSVLLPKDITNKYLYFCYDNGQVSKLSLINLPNLNFEKRGENGKYMRAGLSYIAVGESNSNILLYRHQRSYGKCYKIHDGDWIPENFLMSDQGTQVVNTLNKLKYVLLPSEIDSRLDNLKGKEPQKRVLLDHPANIVQRALLLKLVPDFFKD